MDTKSSRHHAGFALVELLIVVIIAGNLASVAIPLYRRATERAFLTEADTAPGVMERSMRTVLISHPGDPGSMLFLTAQYTPGASLKTSDVIEFRNDETDLDGRFFDNGSYRLQSLTATTYAIYAYGDSSSTPNKNSVSGMIRSINQG